MKLLKKLFAVMFALTLVIGTGTRVNAETTPEGPTIDGAEYNTSYFEVGAEEVDLVGHTFNVVQIIAAKEYDATKNPPYTGISWGAEIEDDGVALLTALKADATLGNDFKNFVTDPAQVTEEKPLFTAASFIDIPSCISSIAFSQR